MTNRLSHTYFQAMNELPLYKRPLSYRFYNATLILIIVNIGMYLISLLFSNRIISTPYARYQFVNYYLALIPYRIVADRAIWQVVTYMFIHGGFGHIFLNMLVLFIFGTRLEQRLGSSEFLLYYFITGVGAGIATLAVNWYTGMATVAVVGASGAILAVVLAFATFFPDTTILVFFIPLPARVAVLAVTGLEIFSLVFRTRSGVAHLTHLAGFVFGYLYFLIRLGINPARVFFRRR